MDNTIAQIIEHVREKQLALDNVLRITKEIEERFGNNDAPGAEMALDLRMEEILSAQACDEEIELIFDKMDIAKALRMGKIVKLQVADMELSEDEQQLYNLYKNIKSIVDRTIEIDKRLSKKIGGASSLYNN